MRLFIILLLLAVCKSAFAQRSVDIAFYPYNTSDIGTYQALGARLPLNEDYSLRAQISYHDNKIELPDRNQELYLHKRFRAFNTLQFFGLIAGVERNLHIFSNDKLRTYCFYELGIRQIGARSYRWIPVDTVYTPGLTQVIHEKRYTEIDKMVSLDNIAGIGLDARIVGNFFFSTNFGAGTNIIFNVPSNIGIGNTVAEYSLKYNIGLIYCIDARNRKKGA